MDEKTESAGQTSRPGLKGLGRWVKTVASEVYAAVRSGKLAQPFSAETVNRASPGHTDGTYRNFLKRYCVGNPGGMAELFVHSGLNRFEITDLRRGARRVDGSKFSQSCSRNGVQSTYPAARA